MMDDSQVSQRNWFRPAVAAWFALLLGGGTLAILLAIPRESLEWRLGAVGLADLHPVFAPPVGGAGLLPLVLVATFAGALIGLLIASRIARQDRPRVAFQHAADLPPFEADAAEVDVVEEHDEPAHTDMPAVDIHEEQTLARSRPPEPVAASIPDEAFGFVPDTPGSFRKEPLGEMSLDGLVQRLGRALETHRHHAKPLDRETEARLRNALIGLGQDSVRR